MQQEGLRAAAQAAEAAAGARRASHSHGHDLVTPESISSIGVTGHSITPRDAKDAASSSMVHAYQSKYRKLGRHYMAWQEGLSRQQGRQDGASPGLGGQGAYGVTGDPQGMRMDDVGHVVCDNVSHDRGGEGCGASRACRIW